tara:strand:- start:957 stop:1424 length:468 start_codon:yes stop_codon:yes gene_type:complete
MSELNKAIICGGCFWGIEENFRTKPGIISTEVGYAGGNSTKTSYEEVCTGTTGHAECVKLVFDSKIISYQKILELFFKMHDPTQKNMQYPDVGTQYRSEIFYLDDNQKKVAKSEKERFNKLLNNKVVTNINPLKTYIKAENYHQKYILKKNETIS